jgi:2-phospho-L-lactate/phosphoenolpyruvate guanylyltransferase
MDARGWTTVIPWRRGDAKSRLPAWCRDALAEAMLADVISACRELSEPVVADAPIGLGPAVALALAPFHGRPVLVVNADLPCVTADDLVQLTACVPAGGVALAAADDGTVNALAYADAALFAPLYGHGSARRFAGSVPAITLRIPNLVDDVDTLGDLARVLPRCGAATRAAARRFSELAA